MPAPPEIDAVRALAFRLAGHHLHERTDPGTAVAACGLQEFPPGHAEVALHARAGDVPADDPVRDAWVLVNAMRGAPHLVPRADLAVFTTALVPEDDDGLRGLIGAAPAKEVEAAGFTVADGLARVAEAARRALADGPLDRDAFHQALRERLPAGLLPWCRGCQSHHVRPGLWRALGPLGVTEMPGKAVWALADPGAPAWTAETARRELARRFLRAFGPASHGQLAAWGQTSTAHAKALLTAVADETTAVRLDGAKRWVLTEDLDRLDDPPPATGLRLLHGHDPYVAQPDRTTLVPDAALRAVLFPAVGRPGVVLHDGRLAGTWRARKSGATLRLAVDWAGSALPLGDAPEALARLRGCTAVSIA